MDLRLSVGVAIEFGQSSKRMATTISEGLLAWLAINPLERNGLSRRPCRASNSELASSLVYSLRPCLSRPKPRQVTRNAGVARTMASPKVNSLGISERMMGAILARTFW